MVRRDDVRARVIKGDQDEWGQREEEKKRRSSDEEEWRRKGGARMSVITGASMKDLHTWPLQTVIPDETYTQLQE